MIDNKNMKSKIGAGIIMLGLIMSSCSLDIEETDSLITEGSSDVFNGVENPIVLRATEIIDPLSAANAEQLAQAKFMRAYCMWIIMDAYGQVPFRNPADGPEVIPTVMTRQEAYTMIVDDLTDAIEDLPNSNATAANKSRAVKETAEILLARVKLNAQVYNGSYGANDLQDVIDLVNSIEDDGYALVDGYFDVFSGPDFSNSDVIWAVTTGVGSKMWNSLHYNQGATDNTGGGWNGFVTLSEFYDKFEGPPETNAIGSGQEERRGYTQTLATTDTDNQGFGYGFQFGQMFGIGDVDYEGPLTTTGPRPIRNRKGAPLVFTKELPGLLGNAEDTGIRLYKYSPMNGAFASGTVVFRFADAYLMRAEAMMRLNTGDPLAEVNALRTLRGADPLASLSEAQLLDERGRELYLEYVRRTDMIRFGVFKDPNGFKGAEDGHTDLFPIPASAILSNPALVQNPGY